jgi:hypothetical protein
MAGFCGHGSKPSVSIKKAGYFFHRLSNYKFFKKCPAPWSKLSKKDNKLTKYYLR